MKPIVKIGIAGLLLLLYTGNCLKAQRITETQARQVADNWITLIEHYNDGWGVNESAEIEYIDILTKEEKQVGYYCQVAPEGFIVLSLYKGLAPVKAYETTGNLKEQEDDELLQYLMQCMKSIMDTIERNLGSMDEIMADELSQILEIDYSNTWEALNIQNEQFTKQLNSGNWDNYQEGEVLTITSWNQTWPYNQYCPDLGCIQSGYNGHAAAGCGPIAASQVMRYWCWPPFHDGEFYNWPDMPLWVDQYSPNNKKHWIAKLVYEVGLSAGADYGCAEDGGTSTYMAGWPGADIEDTFKEHFHYSQDADGTYRRNHGANGWFDILKGQLNLNRPLPYENTNHLFICDGWEELYVFDVLVKMYHMNWGHGGSQTAWYTLDAIPNPNYWTEGALKGVHPLNSIGPGIIGLYPKDLTFFYRYFDTDAVGDAALFSAGQRLQFLHYIKIIGAGTDPGHYITFLGDLADPTILFSQGDQTKGIQINNGSVKLRAGGSIQFKQYNY